MAGINVHVFSLGLSNASMEQHTLRVGVISMTGPLVTVWSCIQLRIIYGTDYCGVQSNGLTPLHRASGGGHVKCVRLLLDRGTGVDAADVSSTSLCQGCAAAGC
jgi:hypothetical protein